MKRIIGVLLALCLFTTYAYSEQRIDKMSNIHFDGIFSDDGESIGNILTTQYSIVDLIGFFGLGNRKDDNQITGNMGIDSVNRQFPIEVIRCDGLYSMYKVSEDGFFYVFWSTPIDERVEPSVIFTSYLSGNENPNRFSELEIGIHTAEDVKMIDPAFDLSLLLSWGICSYSYVNQDCLLAIEYEVNDQLFDYQHLVISNISVIDRDKAPSKYRLIFPQDLPEE